MDWAFKALARASGANEHAGEFKTVAIFSALGLLLSLVVAFVVGQEAWTALL